MFKSAPDVEIYSPDVLFAGRRAQIDIVVTAKKPTEVEFIEARLIGHQGWRIGSGKQTIVSRAEHPDLLVRLMNDGVLEPGAQRFTASFALPEAIAPSHEMTPAWGRLDLRVHVSIPWWLDGRYKFRLPVRLPPPAEVTRKPFAIRSTPHSAAADKPRLELSLASTRLIAGELVVGSVAVFHLDDRKPRDIELQLVPTFKLIRYGRIRERRGSTRGFTVTIPAGGAATSVPFRFELPNDTVPSFTTITHQLEWWLTAKSGSFFTGKVEVAVPLEIVDASAAATTARLETTPRLSDARVTAAFEAFAARHGWPLHASSDEHEQLALEHEVHGAIVRIGYDYRGKEGAFLVARLACSLGLGLAVTPSSSLRELLSKDIEVDIAVWDRAHHVSARSHAQTVPFLTAIVPSVMTAMRVLGPLARWTDHEIVFEQAITSVDETDLVRTSSGLGQLARDLQATAITPPPDLGVDLDAWRRLAHRLRGELTVGDLTIEGELDQLPVDLGLQFDDDGKPNRLRAYVGDPATASELLRGAELAGEHLTGRGDAGGVPPRDWPTDFIELHVSDGVASAALAVVGAADATRALELVQALRGLIARLDPAPGPYR